MLNPKPKPTSPRPEISPPRQTPNPIEKAIGPRAKPQMEPTPSSNSRLSEIVGEPSPTEMLALEELNRQTEERLQEPDEVRFPQTPTAKEIIPASKPDLPPETEDCSPESPPQGIDDTSTKAFEITKNVRKSNAQTLQDVRSGAPIENEKTMAELLGQKLNEARNIPVEDIELTVLKRYIFEDGFVVATVAFHIVILCGQPMVTPSTTTWDFVDRASIPDMVFALLKQPGYLEGIWPSLKIIMGTNKGNAAWCSGIATTIAFFDIIRTLPTLKDMENEKKS